MSHEGGAGETEEGSETIARKGLATDATIEFRRDHKSAEDVGVGSQQKVFAIITRLPDERRYDRTYQIRKWCWPSWPKTSSARKWIDENDGSICRLGVAGISSEDSGQSGTSEFDGLVVGRAPIDCQEVVIKGQIGRPFR